MTAHRASSSLTTEVSEGGPPDPRAASRPESLRKLRALLSVPPLVGDPAYAPAQPAAACTLCPRPESVRTGRDFTRATLRDWDMDELCDRAELVVSELVTNALRHGMRSACALISDPSVRLRLLAQPPFVMCMVTDPGRDIPVLRESAPDAECGRGLTVVEACSVRWGWHLLDEGGKVVWALLR
jgi:anti-sigma regulatory factor (Ser/Thr protein kinase)